MRGRFLVSLKAEEYRILERAVKKNPKDRVLISKASLGLSFLISEMEISSPPRPSHGERRGPNETTEEHFEGFYTLQIQCLKQP